MGNFIRVVETWLPAADGRTLQLGDGLFDAAPAFGAISRTMSFARGEGLPGHAWEEGRPILLHQFEGSYFRRADAARAAHLTCAVALPIFRGTALTSVLVLLCGDVPPPLGAIELWHNDPRITTDLKLVDGYFGATPAAFETLTRDGGLARGFGAPGLAWQCEAAVFIDNVSDARSFLRAQVAAEAGIVSALAIPCSVRVAQTWVLSLLSSRSTPIARRVESWLPNHASTHLRRAFGFCTVHGRLAADESSATPIDALGPIGDSMRRGAARAVAASALPGGWWDAALNACGLHSVVTIPVVSDGAVSEIVALYF